MACIGYLVRFFYVNRQSLQIAFNISISIIILIVLLSIVYLLLHNYRFQLILEKCSGQRPHFWPLFRIFVLGKFLNTFISQAGTVYRGLQLKQDYGISYTNYISSFASFAWMDSWLNMIVAALVILVGGRDLKIGSLYAWQISLVLAICIFAVPLLMEAAFRKISFNNTYLNWTHSKLTEVLKATVENVKDTVYVSKIIILGIAALICAGALYYIYFRIFDITLTIPSLAVFYALLSLSTCVILTPGNVGVQELAYGFLSQQLGFGMAQGILVAVFARISGTAILLSLGITLGGIDLLRQQKKPFNQQWRNHLRFPRIRKFLQYLREYGLIMSVPLTLDISLYFASVLFRKIFYRWKANQYGIKEAIFWSKDIATYLRYSTILGELIPLIRKSDKQTAILEVGPGGEGIARFLKYSRDYNRCKIYLADINPDFLKKVRIASCSQIKGDNLPFENNSFDIVISVAAFEHIPKEKRAVFLRELSRVCKSTILLYFVMDDVEKGFSGKDSDLRFNKWHINRFGSENIWTAEHLGNQYVTCSEIEKSLPGSVISGTQNVDVWFNYMTFTRRLLTGFLTGILYILKWKNKNSDPPFYGCFVKWNKPHSE